MSDEINQGMMEGNGSFEQARFYLENERWEQAEKALRRAAAEHPDDPLPHVWLGLTLGQLQRPDDGLREVQAGIALAPEWPYAHFVAGHLLAGMKRYKQAEAAVREALRLSPLYADADGLLAQILFSQARWNEALQVAEQGLAADASHVGCANLRAMSLTKLRRGDDAQVALETALANDPENALTHANRGWALLESGRHRDAVDSFREALRLDPQQEWARQGIVSSLKARNPVYRLLLVYFFWMSRLRRQVRIVVLFVAWGLNQLLSRLADAQPAVAPFVNPLLIAYLVFCVLTWTADPLFNLLLRFDPVGRYVLSSEQRRKSTAVAACLIAALGALASYLVGKTTDVATVAFLAFMTSIALVSFFNATKPVLRWVLGIVSVLLALLGLSVAVVEGLDHPAALGAMVAVWAVGAGALYGLERRR